MGFMFAAVAVLALLSAGQSAPVTSCEELIRPIKVQRDQLIGRWTIVGESANLKGSNAMAQMYVESTWVKVTAANENDTINFLQSQKVFGSCFTVTYQKKLENSTLSMVKPLTVSAVLLNTGCPDCLVIYSNYTSERNMYSLQLLSTRNTVTAAELEEFEKQAECLNLPLPAILEPGKDFCPEESPSKETHHTTDITEFMNNMGSDVFQLFDRFVNSEDGVFGAKAN